MRCISLQSTVTYKYSICIQLCTMCDWCLVTLIETLCWIKDERGILSFYVDNETFVAYLHCPLSLSAPNGNCTGKSASSTVVVVVGRVNEVALEYYWATFDFHVRRTCTLNVYVCMLCTDVYVRVRAYRYGYRYELRRLCTYLT